MTDDQQPARAQSTNLASPKAPRLDPHLLHTFLVVARAGTITRAAKLLHRSQPAVTAAVKRLEAGFGEPLFTRTARGVRLTHLGTRLQPHAEALERVLGGVEELASEVARLEGARLRIAASTTIALYWLPLRLARFLGAHPTATALVHTRNSVGAIAELSAGEVDLALVESPSSSWAGLQPGLLGPTTVHEDELVLVVDPGHFLARRGRVSPEELGGLEFIGREVGSGTRDVLEKALEDGGIVLDVRLELGEPEAIKRAVRAGLGAAVLSRVAVDAEVERGELVALSIDHPGFRRQFTLLHPPQELAGQAAWAFRTLAVETRGPMPPRRAPRPPTPRGGRWSPGRT